MGQECLFNCLSSLRNKVDPPDEILVVLDVHGRAIAGHSGSVKRLAIEIKSTAKCKVVFSKHEVDWEPFNQLQNLGVDRSKCEYVYITADDVVFPDDRDYFKGVREALNREGPKEIAGAVFPATYKDSGLTCPRFGSTGLTQYFNSVSSVIHKDFWADFGKFDVHWGIPLDVHVHAELLARDAWLRYRPLEPVFVPETRSVRELTGVPPRWEDPLTSFEIAFPDQKVWWDWENWINRERVLLS